MLSPRLALATLLAALGTALFVCQKSANLPLDDSRGYDIPIRFPQAEANSEPERTTIPIRLPERNEAALLNVKLILSQRDGATGSSSKEFADSRVSPEALALIGCQYLIPQNLDQAERYFNQLVEEFPESPVARIGWCGKAWIEAARGEDRESISLLERAEPWRVEIVEGGDDGFRMLLSFACTRLGRYYLGRGEWANSQACWEQWNPDTACGSCHASMLEGKRAFIAYCLLHSGQYDRFCEQILPNVCSGRYEGRRSYAAYLLWIVYERAGQEQDLLEMTHKARELEKVTADRNFSRGGDVVTLRQLSRFYPAHAIAYCSELKRLRETRDVRQLLQELAADLTNSPTDAHLYDWQLRAIADALAGCGMEGLPWIADCLQTGKLPESNNWSISRPWLYYTLGRMQGASAGRMLTDARNWKATSWPDRPAIYFAMRMKGDRFRFSIDSFDRKFGGSQERHQQSAEAALKYLQLELGWPAPALGTLPKDVPPLALTDRELHARQ